MYRSTRDEDLIRRAGFENLFAYLYAGPFVQYDPQLVTAVVVLARECRLLRR